MALAVSVAATGVPGSAAACHTNVSPVAGKSGCGAFQRDVVAAQNVSAPSPTVGRIAVDEDGNYHDPDDWVAAPVTLALVASQGMQANLVHYSYNSSLGANAQSDLMAIEMETSTLGAADRFGFDRRPFFNAQANVGRAVDNLTRQINTSSAADPLQIIAAGPMELIWRALNGADPERRRHVTVISHSPWNNDRTMWPEMLHTDEDVKAQGVQWIQIAPQHALFTRTQRCTWLACPRDKEAWGPWQWLASSALPELAWIHGRMLASGKPDASDAGMAYFLLTGDQHATPEKLRAFLAEAD